jgi:hypothetical protein
MPLRIAFDMDGVLADMESELARVARMLFGAAEATPSSKTQPIDDSTPPVALNLSERQQQRLWEQVRSIENFWCCLNELEPGIVRRLAMLATERRWEVIFLTRRPESAGMTAQVQTQEWLEAKGFPLPSVYVVQGSRGKIAAALALDVVIDDRIENCLDVVVDSKARAILVWRGEEGQLPASARRLGLAVVKSVRECLDLLTHPDLLPAERAGIMTRLRRALGLKEPAGA